MKTMRRLRQLSGLTLEQLGERTGRSFGHLAAIERGERSASAEELERIAASLAPFAATTADDALIAADGIPARLLLQEAEMVSRMIHDLDDEIEDCVADDRRRAAMSEIRKHTLHRLDQLIEVIRLKLRPPA